MASTSSILSLLSNSYQNPKFSSISSSSSSPLSSSSSSSSISRSFRIPSFTSLPQSPSVSSRRRSRDPNSRLSDFLVSALASSAGSSPSLLDALIFDCDGVILESEHLHREAYNDTFTHFDVRCPNSPSGPVHWDSEFYDELQNRIGGGKPKMRWFFAENGWPSSLILREPPMEDSDRAKLIDSLQDWKTERYKEIIRSGFVKPRPGVLNLMDSAKAAGIKLAVCSAATKSSVILCLENLLGHDRFHSLDCFLAGDDFKEKKPDPSIYITASEKLGLQPENCLVIEDSIIGLKAVVGASMSCLVTYTSSTANQDFSGALAVYPDLSDVRLSDLVSLLERACVTS